MRIDPIARTCRAIAARLAAAPRLRLAVFVHRQIQIRCIDLNTESIDGLGLHYRLVGVYGATDDFHVDDLIADVRLVIEQIKADAQ